MKINSGELNQNIQITQFIDTPNGSGGVNPVESVYWSTFARTRPYTSRIANDANQMTLQDGFKFLVRYRQDKVVTEDMRIRWRSGVLKIISAPTEFVSQEYVEFTAVWQNRPTSNV